MVSTISKLYSIIVGIFILSIGLSRLHQSISVSSNYANFFLVIDSFLFMIFGIYTSIHKLNIFDHIYEYTGFDYDEPVFSPIYIWALIKYGSYYTISFIISESCKVSYIETTILSPHTDYEYLAMTLLVFA